MNGDAQDITITRQIIDRAFEDVEDCESIAIVGGEPFLELDMLEYLVDKVTESRWEAEYLQLTTNGTIRSLRAIQILAKYCNSYWKPWRKRKVIIRISNDEFHDPNEYNQAMEFYKTYAGPIKGMSIIYTSGFNTMRMSGRAPCYIQEHPEAGEKYFFGVQSECNHRLKIVENQVWCQVQVSANGLVGVHQGQDFDTIDALAWGNILNLSITDMVCANEDNSLLTCEDCIKLNMARNWHYTYISKVNEDNLKDQNLDENRFLNMLIERNAEFFLKRFIDLRQKARELYPCLPAQDIIDFIPFPENVPKYVLSMAPVLLRNSLVTEQMIKSAIDSETWERYIRFTNPTPFFVKQSKMMMHLLAHFNQTEMTDKGVYTSVAFIKLKQLNEWYKEGKFLPKNNKSYYCKADDETRS